jgi:uncharacterized lipoprotein YbaY
MALVLVHGASRMLAGCTRRRRSMRRIPTVLLSLALVASGLIAAAPAAATTMSVTGQLQMRERVSLSPDAVAVVTLVDQTPSADAGAIIGQQRIDGVAIPAAFQVDYDGTGIDASHSYALYASVIDGTATYQTVEPVPVITGGPTSDVALTLAPLSPLATGQVTGTITRKDKQPLSPEAVAIAILVNADTGTLVARQVIPSPASEPVAFAIPVDPGVLDPAATYLAKAAIVDGTTTWENRDGVAAVENGAPASDLAVPVTRTPGSLPGPSASPSVEPSTPPSVEPSASPTEAPTEAPTATPAPTEAPTATPTATPTEPPTPSESANSSVSPSESPSATPGASPSEEPTTGVVRGTLTYRESHQLSADARAVVLLLDASGPPSPDAIVASTTFQPTGPPAPFELSYAYGDIHKDPHYALYAGIVDGDLAWVTPVGVVVDVPQPLIEVVIPLSYRPDLLKGAVTGTLVGDGLDPGGNAAAFGVVIVTDVDAGETLGFQLISPVGASPIAFGVPWDPRSASRDAPYVLRAWVWDGAAWWASSEDPPVITNGNPTSGITLPVNRSITPPPAPDTLPESSGRSNVGLWLIIMLMIAAGATVAYAVYKPRG